MQTGRLARTAKSIAAASLTPVKAPVVLCGHTFEGILDTGASDTAVSHAVVRRLGLMDVVVPTDATFSTAGGGTEAPMGVLKDFPIRIGSLVLKIDAMVTPADNYTILVGNDWLRMAESDLLLSKGVLRVRINTDQWEDIPIDTAVARRPTSFMWHPPEHAPGSLQSEEPMQPNHRRLDCLTRLTQLRQLSVRAEDMLWRRFPDLTVTTIQYWDPILHEVCDMVRYDVSEAKRVTGFQGCYSWNEFSRTELQCYEYDYELHLAEQAAQTEDPNLFAYATSDSLPDMPELVTDSDSEAGQLANTIMPPTLFDSPEWYGPLGSAETTSDSASEPRSPASLPL